MKVNKGPIDQVKINVNREQLSHKLKGKQSIYKMDIAVTLLKILKVIAIQVYNPRKSLIAFIASSRMESTSAITFWSSSAVPRISAKPFLMDLPSFFF